MRFLLVLFVYLFSSITALAQEKPSIFDELRSMDRVRIFVTDSVNFGHQSSAIRLMNQVVAAGFQGTIELLYQSNSTRNKINTMLPELISKASFALTPSVNLELFKVDLDFNQPQKNKAALESKGLKFLSYSLVSGHDGRLVGLFLNSKYTRVTQPLNYGEPKANGGGFHQSSIPGERRALFEFSREGQLLSRSGIEQKLSGRYDISVLDRQGLLSYLNWINRGSEYQSTKITYFSQLMTALQSVDYTMSYGWHVKHSDASFNRWARQTWQAHYELENQRPLVIIRVGNQANQGGISTATYLDKENWKPENIRKAKSQLFAQSMIMAGGVGIPKKNELVYQNGSLLDGEELKLWSKYKIVVLDLPNLPMKMMDFLMANSNYTPIVEGKNSLELLFSQGRRVLSMSEVSYDSELHRKQAGLSSASEKWRSYREAQKVLFDRYSQDSRPLLKFILDDYHKISLKIETEQSDIRDRPTPTECASKY
ncbi:MAG: hypothetical protein AB8E15_00395 [Bdellovibrionales bacterium]